MRRGWSSRELGSAKHSTPSRKTAQQERRPENGLGVDASTFKLTFPRGHAEDPVSVAPRCDRPQKLHSAPPEALVFAGKWS